MELQIRVNGEWKTLHEADTMEVRLVEGDTVVMPRFTASKGQKPQ